MAPLEVAWHGCFAKYTKVGKHREGMGEEWEVKNEKKKKKKKPHEMKRVSQMFVSLFLSQIFYSHSYCL